MPLTQAQAIKEDTLTLRQMADQLVGKLSALVPHLHTLHADVAGCPAPTETPTSGTISGQGGAPANAPSVYDSLFTAHAIVNQIEDDLASLRGKV